MEPAASKRSSALARTSILRKDYSREAGFLAIRRRICLTATTARQATHDPTIPIRRVAAVETDTPRPAVTASQAAMQAGHLGRRTRTAAGAAVPAAVPQHRRTLTRAPPPSSRREPGRRAHIGRDGGSRPWDGGGPPRRVPSARN